MMQLSAKTIRKQLTVLKPLMAKCSLEANRKMQHKIGLLGDALYRKHIFSKEHSFNTFDGAWILPKDERRQGVILYLHGGGYTCGDLEYAKLFGSALAIQCGTRIFCAAYRLAPEHPFPAALEDALEAYEYLIRKGYTPEQIALCGESAGGGLCYALCLKLRALNQPLPGGIIAISPWMDLTASGNSYKTNQELDPIMSCKLLDFYTKCYTNDRKNPLVSPLFGDLHGFPPSLLFAGSDEIMLSDTTSLHEKLQNSGCKSRLIVAPERWHGYVLYDLQENKEDFSIINHFLNRHIAPERKLRWMRLDNAAKIYPAARRQNWSNVFRLSATLTETIDRSVMQSALDVTVRRFPSIAARLRRGMFWYYLQQLQHAPAIQKENSYPLARMSFREMRRCAFRVLVYRNRVAVEFFHSLTDGNGALIFLKTLVAEYLQQKYHIAIPNEKGVLGRLEEPSAAELEDSFLKYSGDVAASRKENTAWHLSGTPELDGFLHLTCFQIPVQAILEKAHEYQVSLTVFLTAAMLEALLKFQQEKVPKNHKKKPLKVLIPVNLRNLFPSKTLRNFALYTTPEIDPRLGNYTFPEICNAVRHRMGMDINPQQMSAKIATNVHCEQMLAVRLLPLFLKNIVMKAVFTAVGERKSCLSLSNLGNVQLPEEMKCYVKRLDFILGTQATAPHNCGVISYGDTLYINILRNIRESDLELQFYSVLRDMGLPVQVESNQSS